jgi:ribosomal protein S12 methylthiotransferase
MRTRSLNPRKVNVITLGCSKNIFDSEIMMAQLQANNFEVGHETDDDDAGVVIVNTCGFIDNAKEESINTILQFADAKTKGLVDKLYVTGCLSQRYAGDLKAEIPEVDAWFGTRDLALLLKAMKADYRKELVGERLLTTPAHYAYFKIAEGCDRPCSFCAIPLMRGKHLSTPMDQLVENAQSLAAQGVKELILIAQDLTYYGLDLYKKRNLAELLTKLSEIEGIEWIRLHYAFPAGFPEDILDVIAENPKVCHYLDMPLQHATTRMLKLMRRGITREKTDALVSKIREKIPGIAIRTTLISGFPGETLEDHQEMVEWVQEQRFERLGVFTYSHEENTHAYLLEDDVPAEEKRRRADEIMEVQSHISYEANQKLVGKELRVLIDRKEGDEYVGRTEFDSPEVDNEVRIFSPENYVRVGDFIDVTIDSADFYDLFGSIKSK